MFVKKLLGLLAVGGLLVVAAPTPQAQAASPLTPGVTTAIITIIVVGDRLVRSTETGSLRRACFFACCCARGGVPFRI